MGIPRPLRLVLLGAVAAACAAAGYAALQPIGGWAAPAALLGAYAALFPAVIALEALDLWLRRRSGYSGPCRYCGREPVDTADPGQAAAFLCTGCAGAPGGRFSLPMGWTLVLVALGGGIGVWRWLCR